MHKNYPNILGLKEKMASTTISNVLFIIIALILSHVLNAEEPGVINSFPSLKSCKIDKIYQLGDSFSDTGNLMIEMPLTPAARLPYGETFFKKPTGRFSNGLLMIDFIGMLFNFLDFIFFAFICLCSRYTSYLLVFFLHNYRYNLYYVTYIIIL